MGHKAYQHPFGTLELFSGTHLCTFAGLCRCVLGVCDAVLIPHLYMRTLASLAMSSIILFSRPAVMLHLHFSPIHRPSAA